MFGCESELASLVATNYYKLDTSVANLDRRIRGWIGDNPFIFLDTKKIQATGWKPKLTIAEAVVVLPCPVAPQIKTIPPLRSGSAVRRAPWRR